MRYKGYAVSYADEELKFNKENFFINGKCHDDIDQLSVFQMNKDFGRRNFYAVTSGVKCDEAGDELSQIAVDILKGFYGSDFAEDSRTYFGMTNSAVVGHVFERKDKHFEVDTSILYIENDVATVYNFGDMPVLYYENNKLKKLSGNPPQSVEIEKNVYDNRGTAHLQVLKKNNIPHIGFSGEECETVSYVSESIKLKHKAYFVLCSKSVLDILGEREIKKILADTTIKGGGKATRIIDNAVKKSPNGNYTVLVVQVDKGIPVAESDVKSVGGWALVALLCAVLYFTSSYLLRTIYVVAENVKSFMENSFNNEAEPNLDLKWTPREGKDEGNEQIDESAEQNDENAEAETDKSQTNEVARVQPSAVSQQEPARSNVQEQASVTQTNLEQYSDTQINQEQTSEIQTISEQTSESRTNSVQSSDITNPSSSTETTEDTEPSNDSN